MHGIRQVTVRPNGRLSAIADANLPKDRLDVDFDGRFGDIKLTCDNFVGFALHKTAENPPLPL
jgi:hypothetical protein